MLAYSVLARYYDRLMTDYNYSGLLEYIENNVKQVKGIDLACGSGKLTAELALTGRRMTGIDLSREMLNIASRNAYEKGLKIPFIEGNILDIELPIRYGFIVASCDVINYIPPNRLQSLINKLYHCLDEGGSFVFDFSSAYKLRQVIGNNVFYGDYPDMTYIWSNCLIINEVEMDLIFFVKEKEQYRRSEENHTQYIYETEDIIKNLNDAGFTIDEVLCGDTFSKPSTKTQRILIRAGKRNGQDR